MTAAATAAVIAVCRLAARAHDTFKALEQQRHIRNPTRCRAVRALRPGILQFTSGSSSRRGATPWTRTGLREFHGAAEFRPRCAPNRPAFSNYPLFLLGLRVHQFRPMTTSATCRSQARSNRARARLLHKITWYIS